MKTLIFLLFPISLSGQIQTGLWALHDTTMKQWRADYDIIRPGPPTTDWKPQGRIIRNERATLEVFDDLHLLNKRTAVTAGLSLASGLCYGIHETVVHKPNRIPDNWNRRWWDSRESWRNKYADGDPAQVRGYGQLLLLMIRTKHRP